jgi:hypothetical protein
MVMTMSVDFDKLELISEKRIGFIPISQFKVVEHTTWRSRDSEWLHGIIQIVTCGSDSPIAIVTKTTQARKFKAKCLYSELVESS